MLTKILQYTFKFLARQTVRRRKPIVIAVTGTVGKTSTREAIAKVLATTYRVRTPKKNFNNEWGVPFTIIGVEPYGRNPFRWLWALYRGIEAAFCLCRMQDYPEVLVLEYGIDKPGDMEYLAGICALDAAVITALGEIPVHVSNFTSRESLWDEKLKIARALKPDGILFYGADDAALAERASKASVHHRAFGQSRTSHIKAEQVQMMEDTDGLPVGISCTVCVGDACRPLHIPRLAGVHQLSGALAAVAVGDLLKVPAARVEAALRELKPLPGRLNALGGVKNTWILDDTYNASPQSTKAALAVLAACKPRRRIAVLGDMLELGGFTEEAHHDIGACAAASCDLIITVGAKAKFIAEAAMQEGMKPEALRSFEFSTEAGKPLESMLKPGDVVLVKGSQGMRMERVVEEVMAEPQRKRELLVRQDASWLGL
ncbi:MAG: UDP-N-acetylmuramoyl-tripeptide--D-alanyl-D-alanine ligase [bacterium]|nr:UDP-N-acetylmuramoyl-tripeptide--D-alanyl-D-alanine ligase [bacterium]